MKPTTTLVTLGLLFSAGVSVQAAILFSENFDSYANGAAATTIPGITTAGFGTADSATVSTAQALSGANSLKYTRNIAVSVTSDPNLFFNFSSSVTPATMVLNPTLNVSFSYQKSGDAYDPTIWVMFGNQANAGFANGNTALRNNGLNTFFDDADTGFQGTGGNETAWHTVNISYKLTTNGTSITGYTADYTTAGGFFTPSFSVTKTGLSLTSIDSLRMQFRGNDGDVYFDNVSINSVPEPSTAALAGLAALGFAFTRRRRA